MWFNISLRLGKIYLDETNKVELEIILAALKKSCEDEKKDNLLLEVYALEIQMCTKTKDKKRLKRIYARTENLNSVINDPRVIGIIRECGGKMYMSEKKWDLALDELFESFKNYQESGNHRAKDILIYVILASILCQSKINHADTREARVYKEDKEIIAIMQLRSAYEKNDIIQIQKILGDKSNKIFSDPDFT